MNLNLSNSDRQKIIVIFAMMTVGLPIYSAFMSYVGVIDQPVTVPFLAINVIIGLGMGILMIFFYIWARNSMG